MTVDLSPQNIKDLMARFEQQLKEVRQKEDLELIKRDWVSKIGRAHV